LATDFSDYGAKIGVFTIIYVNCFGTTNGVATGSATGAASRATNGATTVGI
jgi:hypothetical protein